MEEETAGMFEALLAKAREYVPPDKLQKLSDAYQFAENMEAFNAAGATVIGVSLDSIERLNDFSADPEYCAGKLAVASDIDGSISQSFDISVRQRREGMTDTRGIAVDHDLAERTTFIVTSDGRIAETIGGISPIENVEQSLAAVQRLQ